MQSTRRIRRVLLEGRLAHGQKLGRTKEGAPAWHAVSMRAILQRAANARVTVGGEVVGSFDGPGIVLLVGVTHGDDDATAARLADKVYGLRIFEHRHASDATCLPPSAPREISARDLELPVLIVSQFTLYAETRKGRRPTWDQAAPGSVAEPIIDAVAAAFTSLGAPVSNGRFGADMQVTFTNDGPVTISLEM